MKSLYTVTCVLTGNLFCVAGVLIVASMVASFMHCNNKKKKKEKSLG